MWSGAGRPAVGRSLPTGGATSLERASVVRLIVPDQAAFQGLVDSGADLTGHVLRSPNGTVEADVVATPAEVDALRGLGIITTSTTRSPAQAAQARPNAAAGRPSATAAAAPDQVTIDRAVWFKTRDGYFI